MRVQSTQASRHRDTGQETGARVYSPAFFRSEVHFVDALRAGRSDAHTELLRRYHDRVAAVLQRILGDECNLTEAVQQVFGRAMASAHHFDGRSAALEQWLTKIAVTHASELVRKRRGWRRLFFSSSLRCISGRAGVVHAGSSVLSSAEVETLRRTYAILDHLPAAERVVLALELLDQMPVSDIAEACGTSTSTVWRRLSRARNRFDVLAAGDDLLGRPKREAEVEAP